jgi:hypothetical protein
MWEFMPISGQEAGTMQTSARKDGMKVGMLAATARAIAVAEASTGPLAQEGCTVCSNAGRNHLAHRYLQYCFR